MEVISRASTVVDVFSVVAKTAVSETAGESFAEHLSRAQREDTPVRSQEASEPPEQPVASEQTVSEPPPQQESHDDSHSAPESTAEGKPAKKSDDADSQSDEEPTDDTADEVIVAAVLAQAVVTDTPAEVVQAEAPTEDVPQVLPPIVEQPALVTTEAEPVATAVELPPVECCADDGAHEDERQRPERDPKVAAVAGNEKPVNPAAKHDATSPAKVETDTREQTVSEPVANQLVEQPENARDRGPKREGEEEVKAVAETPVAAPTETDSTATAVAERRDSHSEPQAVKAGPVEASSPTNADGQPNVTAAPANAGSKLPGHLLSANGSRSEGDGQLSEVQQSRFLTRVAKAFETARERGGELRLRLSPPELGSLRLEVKLQAGVMTARLETETQAAKTTLLENLPVLRERLAEQGVKIERFDVDITDRRQPGQQEQASERERRPPPRERTVVREPEVTRAVSERRSDGRLNVFV